MLFHCSKDDKITSKTIISYSENELCCRKILFSDFEYEEPVSYPCSGCVCCDVCNVKCECENCKKSLYLVSYAFTHC